MFEGLEQRFREVLPAADFCSLRAVDEYSEIIRVRQDVLQPIQLFTDCGAMVTVMDRGGYGYAATSDLSTAGLRQAVQQALDWAHLTAGRSVFDYRKIAMPHPRGEYESPLGKAWETLPMSAVMPVTAALR